MKVDDYWTAFKEKRRRRSGKYRTAEIRVLKAVQNVQQVRVHQDDTLRLEGSAKPSDGFRKMPLQNLQNLRIIEARLDGALEEVSQHQAALLKLRQDSVGRLPLGGKLHGIEKLASFALETTFGRVEEIGIIHRGDVAKKKGLNVKGTIARGAFQPVQAASDMLGGGKLPATITAEEACACGGHAKA
jgi:hypothetical protein